MGPAPASGARTVIVGSTDGRLERDSGTLLSGEFHTLLSRELPGIEKEHIEYRRETGSDKPFRDIDRAIYATITFHLTQNTDCKTQDVDSWKHRTSYGLRGSQSRRRHVFSRDRFQS